jgi:hypothetical protein
MTAASPDGHGLWLGDTRLLSEFQLRVDGSEPADIGLREEAGWLAFELAAGDLHVLRERFVDGGLHERITFANRGASAIHADIVLEFGADHAAMLAVRGIISGLPASPSIEPEIYIRPEGKRRHIELRPGQSSSLVIDVPA